MSSRLSQLELRDDKYIRRSVVEIGRHGSSLSKEGLNLRQPLASCIMVNVGPIVWELELKIRIF